MHAPEFWSRRSSVAARALAPVAALYALAARLRQGMARPREVAVPVICVGNLTVGGGGKTPVALALAPMVRALGRAPHFLTRGYRGRLAGPVLVDPAVHDAGDVGDEPLLLTVEAPCWVSRDRVAGTEAAIAAGAEAIVMDDGFQNPSLRKALSFVVVDGAVGFGNGRVLPAGPLRERIGDGLRRASAVILVGPTAESVGRDVTSAAGAIPVLLARFEIDPGTAEALRGRDVVAFAGLARPEKFFASLRALGCNLVAAVGHSDHRPYDGSEIAALRQRASEMNAVLATTAKDHVRLPAGEKAAVLRVDGRLVFEAPDQVSTLLASALASPEPAVS